MKQPVRCLSRKTLSKRIKDESDTMIQSIREQLADVSYVCTTADIWSSYRRSFLGVTVHWINPQTFTRKSAAIACRRFEGTHNYTSIARHLTEIHDQYGLNSQKIICTITDNASNFKKAFAEFGIEFETTDDESETYDYTDDEKNVEFANINEFVETNEEEEVYYLPKRNSCISHTLSLLCTADIEKLKKSNRVYGKMHKSVLQKCNNIWNKTNRSSTQTSEKYKVDCWKSSKNSMYYQMEFFPRQCRGSTFY